MDFEMFARAFGALFAIMNPFVTLPVLFSLTGSETPAEVRRTGLTATFYAAVMCGIVAVGGQAILSLFGITIDDLRVAGGLVLFLVGLGMVTGAGSTAEPGASDGVKDSAQADVAFYPLAFPMIMGPGTVTTILIFAGQAHDVEQYSAVGGALILVLAIMAVVMFFATSIGRLLSQKLRAIMTRIMGLILAAIAAELVTTGLRSLLPGLA